MCREGFFVVFLSLTVLRLGLVSGKKGFGPGEQDWGYVDVRPGAHMFYWLYYTTASNIASYTDRPLAIWLQGGPGGSSTLIGNFDELGPLTREGNYRNHTWVKDMNVLFIDNPVGTGFSYVDDEKLLTTTNNEIALDLVAFMKEFYVRHPEFEEVPLHIFSQSYGGKMSPEFALELYDAIQRGELRSNLTSVGLGSPWTSPIDSVMSWAPLLLQAGMVDYDGYNEIMAYAKKTEELVNAGKWLEATLQWDATIKAVQNVSISVDFYYFSRPQHITPDDTDLMASVRKALGLHDYESHGNVFTAQSVDFMKPAVHIVTELLDRTDVNVAVYTGQMDLICSTPGTVNWVNKMNWSYKAEYEVALRQGIFRHGILEGYEKSAGKFSLFWINRSGHSIPLDNPKGMSHILQKLTNVAIL